MTEKQSSIWDRTDTLTLTAEQAALIDRATQMAASHDFPAKRSRAADSVSLTTVNGLVPPPDEVAQVARSTARGLARRRRVSVVASDAGGKQDIGPAHGDQKGWQARMLDTLGTASPAFAAHVVEQIALVVRSAGERYATTDQLNSALAFIDGLEVANEAEAMAAALLYATNDLALTMLRRAKQSGNSDATAAAVNSATKLLRAATAQSLAMAQLRRGGEQTVRVEHVHVHAGGQAIVGSVTAGGGVKYNLEGQSHEQYAEGASIAPLLGVNAAGDIVSVASDAERPVPNARRHQSRSADRQS